MIQINQNAPVKHRDRILINAPAEKVFNMLSNVPEWPIVFPEIRKVEIEGTAEAGKTFVWNNNGSVIKSVFHTVEENRLIGWTGKSMGTKAIHNWYFTESGNKTEVFMEESMEGFLAKLLARMLNKMLQKGSNQWLEALKLECEKD